MSVYSISKKKENVQHFMYYKRFLKMYETIVIHSIPELNVRGEIVTDSKWKLIAN
jgi:hypothetical protein